MKNYFTIKETADLYELTPDMLRYYEKKGLLHPERGPNRYRLYQLSDLYRLTIIRDLRKLGFSTSRIRTYLDDFTLTHTLEMLKEEEAAIQKTIRQMKTTLKDVQERQERLLFYQKEPATFSIQHFSERPYLRMQIDVDQDEEVDFALKKLHSLSEFPIPEIGQLTIGAEFSSAYLQKERQDRYQAVLILLKENKKATHLLPEGQYACLRYKGSYNQLPEALQQFENHLHQSEIQATGPVLELYNIDNRFTQDETEFVTEIQVQIRP